MNRPALIAIAVMTLAAGGCGSVGGGAGGGNSSSKRPSPNGPASVTSRTPARIELASEAAADEARSVHVVLMNTSGPVPAVVNVELVQGRGGRGSISSPGKRYEMLRTGRYVYFRLQADATGRYSRLKGKWFKTSVTDPTFAFIAQATDYHNLVANTLFHPGLVTKGAIRRVNGENAIALIDPYGGTLYVATTGPPYPLEFDGSLGGVRGRAVFDRWNAPVSLTPPPHPLSATDP
jgi:hypothetical protein